jgi:ABC-type glutathione transport system ATPase component
LLGDGSVTVLVEVQGLTVRFSASRGNSTLALDGVDLEVGEGETVGVVGESGSGKTTLGRALLGLQRREAGSVRYRGQEVGGPEVSQPALRRLAQIVFQDSQSSLNPRLSVARTLGEVLGVTGWPRERVGAEVLRLLELVGLPPEVATALPHALSGGQRQRVGIARALAVKPEFMVLDEPVSALDVSVQARILNLLLDLQQRMGLTYLFISHDLAVVRRMSDRILVLREGRVVEAGPTEEIISRPSHPYTRALLAAALPGFGPPPGSPTAGPGEHPGTGA